MWENLSIDLPWLSLISGSVTIIHDKIFFLSSNFFPRSSSLFILEKKILMNYMIIKNYFYFLIIWKGISFMWKNTWNFHQIFTFWDPLSQKKWFLRKSFRIGLKSGTYFENPKRKNEFVKQPHPTKIVKSRAFFVFEFFFFF